MDEAIKIMRREILSRGYGLLERIAFRRRKFNTKTQEVTHEIYDTGNGAAILLYDPTRSRVVLVRQFRLPIYLANGRETMIEVCAGKLEGLTAARRIVMEVSEETGLSIGAPKFLFDAFMSPGVFTECLSFFVARYSPADRVSHGGGLAEDGEDIEILEPTLDEALAMIDRGEIIDARTIILLQYAKLAGLMRDEG
jgi:GDP-mannose pyrophosphatase NudK